MSETQSNVRVVLGPVARDLIAGHSGNRQQALDDAIEALKSGQQTAASVTANPDQSASSELTELRESIDALKRVFVLEQKLTRIYIASLMEETEDAQEQLLVLAHKAINEVISERGFLKDKELKDILDEEDYRRDLLMQPVEEKAAEEDKELDEEMER